MKKLIVTALALSLLLSGAAVAAHAVNDVTDANANLTDTTGVPNAADADDPGQIEPDFEQEPAGIAVGECNGSSCDGLEVGLPVPPNGQNEGPSGAVAGTDATATTSASGSTTSSGCFTEGEWTVCIDPPAPVSAPGDETAGSDGETIEGRDPQTEPEPVTLEKIAA